MVAATASAAHFRSERLAITDSWSSHYKQARGKFELLFKQLNDLNPGAINNASLAESETTRGGVARLIGTVGGAAHRN